MSVTEMKGECNHKIRMDPDALGPGKAPDHFQGVPRFCPAAVRDGGFFIMPVFQPRGMTAFLPAEYGTMDSFDRMINKS